MGSSAEGITVAEAIVGDSIEAWEAAGFAVDDDGTSRVGRVRIRLVGPDRGHRIRSWALRGIDDAVLDHGEHGAHGTDGFDGDTALDGLPTSTSTADPCEPATHPNGVMSIDHLVISSPDHLRTIAALEGAGLDARRTRPTEVNGTPFLQTFFRAGEVIIELVGPEAPQGTGPTRFVGLAFTVADIDATTDALGPLLGPVKDAVQPGRRIATLRHQEVGASTPIAFLSPHPRTNPASDGAVA